MELVLTTAVDEDNPNVGDLYLDPSGNAVLTEDLASEVTQRLIVRFNFWRGDWFRDLREGAPYLEEIFVKGPQDAVIRSVFAQIVSETKGVASVTALDYSLDKVTRELTVMFQAQLEDGTTYRSTDWPPFIVRAVQ